VGVRPAGRRVEVGEIVARRQRGDGVERRSSTPTPSVMRPTRLPPWPRADAGP
jgi:hypothetical protein